MNLNKPALYPGLVLYRCVLWLALPVVMVRLWFRGKRDPLYKPRWRERFGFYSCKITCGGLWFHTVSAGESIAAAPMIREIARGEGETPNERPILVTTMTPTGSEQVKALLGDCVDHCYAPYDFTFAVRRFLAHAKPQALVLMETEIWPNLILEAKAQGIPVVLLNARLSPRSARGYRRFSWLGKRVLSAFDTIACQTQEHAQRFAELGVSTKRLQVLGNVKFDLDLPKDLSARVTQLQARISESQTRSWIAASTHAGEEEWVLRVHQQMLQTVPNLMLWLAPRHPNRVSELTPLLDRFAGQMPGGWCRYSDLLDETQLATAKTSVVVVDQMGVMMPLYELAEVAFVGGSLVAHGGHNPIEPASLRTPVLTGPYYFNFAQVYTDLMQAGASQIVDQDSLEEVLLGLLEQSEQRLAMGNAGSQVVAANQGAKHRSISLIKSVLSAAIHA